MDYEPKFMSLDNKDSCCEKVEMPRKVVFYPYFHFKALKSGDNSNGGETEKAYLSSFDVKDFEVSKVLALEKDVSKDRTDEYGFWTLKDNDGFHIGLGAKGLVRALESMDSAEVSYVLLKGIDVLFIYSFGKSEGEYRNAKVDIYFTDANTAYLEKAKAVGELVTLLGLKAPGEELSTRVLEFQYKKYLYRDARKTEKLKNHFVFPPHPPGSFLPNVQGCTWHTTVVNDDIVNDGPHYVLLKNCDLSLGNVMDDLSSWLVHRRGGFVMGKEFASNDFDQDTTFTIQEVDEYVIDGITILNVECDTYSKNQDASFEKFLKNIAESRFTR